MKRMNPERFLTTGLLACGSIMAASALAQSQGGYGPGSGGMMGNYGPGWMGGGYGGMWALILLVIVVAGLVAWIVARRRK